jgi:putative spermidine/putrescine transport system substrate-binding protein
MKKSAQQSAEGSGERLPEAAASRRRILRTASGGVMAAAMGSLIPSFSRAADKKDIVMTMSGGSFMTNWQTKIIEPFQRLTGYRVTMVSGNTKAQAMQVRASRGSPPFDVVLDGGSEYFGLIATGRLMPLDAVNVPNLKDVDDKFKKQWQGYGAHFDYSSVGIAYRSDRVKNPPTSWREFIDRTQRGEFGKTVFFNSLAAGVRGPEVMMTMARALTGDPTHIDSAFDAVKRMKPNIFKFFTAFNDPVVMLLNGEGTIGPGWDGRTYSAQEQSNGKIAWINPKEGAASSGPPIGVVKGGNTEGAFALVNYALGVEAQKAFCEAMLYGSVNRKVVYSDTLAKRVPSIGSIRVFDEQYIDKNIAAWIDKWNQEIAA